MPLLPVAFFEAFLAGGFFTADFLVTVFFVTDFFFTVAVLLRVLRAVVLATFLLAAGFFVLPVDVSAGAVLTVVPLMVI